MVNTGGRSFSSEGGGGSVGVGSGSFDGVTTPTGASTLSSDVDSTVDLSSIPKHRRWMLLSAPVSEERAEQLKASLVAAAAAAAAAAPGGTSSAVPGSAVASAAGSPVSVSNAVQCPLDGDDDDGGGDGGGTQAGGPRDKVQRVLQFGESSAGAGAGAGGAGGAVAAAGSLSSTDSVVPMTEVGSGTTAEVMPQSTTGKGGDKSADAAATLDPVARLRMLLPESFAFGATVITTSNAARSVGGHHGGSEDHKSPAGVGSSSSSTPGVSVVGSPPSHHRTVSSASGISTGSGTESLTGNSGTPIGRSGSGGGTGVGISSGGVPMPGGSAARLSAAPFSSPHHTHPGGRHGTSVLDTLSSESCRWTLDPWLPFHAFNDRLCALLTPTHPPLPSARGSDVCPPLAHVWAAGATASLRRHSGADEVLQSPWRQLTVVAAGRQHAPMEVESGIARLRRSTMYLLRSDGGADDRDADASGGGGGGGGRGGFDVTAEGSGDRGHWPLLASLRLPRKGATRSMSAAPSSSSSSSSSSPSSSNAATGSTASAAGLPFLDADAMSVTTGNVVQLLAEYKALAARYKRAQAVGSTVL